MTIRKYLAAQYLDDEPGALPEELQGWPEFEEGSIPDPEWDDPENDLIDEPTPDSLVRTIKLTPVRECEAIKKENVRLRGIIKSMLENARTNAPFGDSTNI